MFEVIKLFEELGCEVENLWREQNYNEDIFPRLTADALIKADLPSKVSAWEIVEWALSQPELPPQKDPQARFGEPPVTLFVAPRFYIDAYIWLEGTTAIHQHGFCGAFQVLMGSSIHSWYEFDLREKINTFAEIGDMRLKLCELLKIGDVKQILAGRQYIHSLFHLDQPSVTIVVRTDRSPLFPPQFSYFKPSLAFDPFYEHETTTRKRQLISALFRAKHPETDRMINDLLGQSDFHTSFLLLQTLYDWVRSDEITKLFDQEAPQRRFDGFLEAVSRKHGDKARELERAFARQGVIQEIISRRAVVADPEHRFFLALLLNVDGKNDIFSLIKQRFPDADPVDKVLDWAYDLAQTRVVGMNIPNALGLADFDSFDLSVLEYLLKDLNEEEMTEHLAKEYPAEMVAKLAPALEKIRSAVIFAPLLAAA